MSFLRTRLAVAAFSASAVALVACAGANNTATLAGDGQGEAGQGGESGEGGTTSTKPVGGKGGASGKGGVSGQSGSPGEGGASGKGGAAGKSGASGKGGTTGKGGAAGTGAAGKSGAAGVAGKSGGAGSGTAGAAGSGATGCDPNDEGDTFDANRTLAERADEDCEESLEGVSSGPGDVDWFSYHGIDNPNLLDGCNTKPYARFLPNEGAKEICIFVVQDGFGNTPACVQGTPSTDGPAGGLLGEVYGCCDAQEVQLDYNQSILADNATVYIRVTAADDADCRPYKITHAYGE